jgi:hypothetical protein
METEEKGALNEDNPEPPEDAGQKGAGAATGGDEGFEGGTEPGGGHPRAREAVRC